MNIVNIEAGRVMQLFVADEVKAERDMYLPHLIELFRQRYGFTVLPKEAEARASGAKFQLGRLLLEDQAIAIDNLDIYNDGIIVTCRNTDLAEIVLQDVVSWAMATFGLRQPKTIIPPKYTSWLVVEFDKPTSALIEKFSELQGIFSDAYEQTYNERHQFEIAKLTLSVDPQSVPQHTNTDFIIDRRLGMNYELNRFFCSAPLRTADHVAVLRKVERVFVSGR